MHFEKYRCLLRYFFPPTICLGPVKLTLLPRRHTSPLLPQKTKEMWHDSNNSYQFLQVHHIKYPIQIHSILVGNCSAQESKDLQRVVDSAQSITQTNLSPHWHPNHSLFSPLLSGTKVQCLESPTARFKNSFFPIITDS